MSAALQDITLCWKLKLKPNQIDIVDGVFAESVAPLVISKKNCDNIFHFVRSPDKAVVVIGSPIIESRVDRALTAQTILNSENLDKVCKSLNGEFLIVLFDFQKQVLQICNDRFTSYPAFWAMNEEEFVLSYSYLSLAKHCKNWSGFRLLPERAYEFFVLNRLVGNHTHDNCSQSLAPASILTIAGKSNNIRSYWTPNYEKNLSASKRELINIFSNLFSHAVQTRAAGAGKTTGIFLSGGHDSRLVSMYTDPGATCYTLSFSDNLEVKAAQAIAEASGHDHVFCKLDEAFFEKILDESTALSGGLYSYDHAIFLKSFINPKPTADVFLHGHGLDYMYQGMYLHAQYYHLFGRHTYLRQLLPFPGNILQYFTKKISFRLKYDFCQYFIDDSQKSALQESLTNTVREKYNKAKTLSDNPYDHWEYLILHQISKHYTFSNALSKRTCGELRTPSFDNDLYDFYLSLPHQYRLHGDIIRGAMYLKNPIIANMRTANHGMPAGWGPYKKSAYVIYRKLMRSISNQKTYRTPEGKDRTWPGRENYFHGGFEDEIEKYINDHDFHTLISFLDWKSIKNNYKQILQEKHGGSFLVTLLSYYKFFKAVYN